MVAIPEPVAQQTMWCPMARRHYDERAGVGLSNMPNEQANTCAGSNCAAWRWFDHANTQKIRRGFCGLAGKPLFGE
jgi:hypothetical protein